MTQEKLSGLNLLLSVDRTNTLSFIINGTYPLATLGFSDEKVLQADFSLNLNSLHCVSFNKECTLQTFDMSILTKKSKQIQEIAEIYALVQNLLKDLDKGIKEVVKEATNVCNSFVGRYLNGIEDSIKQSGNTSTVEELLSQCAGTGVISPCLSKFIKEEMQNTKLITQYEEKIAIQVKNCQITLILNCKNSISGLIFFLTVLINYTKCSAYAPLGLNKTLLENLKESLGSLMQKVLKTMGLLSNAHSDIKNTLNWLHN